MRLLHRDIISFGPLKQEVQFLLTELVNVEIDLILAILSPARTKLSRDLLEVNLLRDARDAKVHLSDSILAFPCEVLREGRDLVNPF